MTKTASVKRDRLHLRLDRETKETIERAAACSKQTATEFVLGHAVSAARRVLRTPPRVVVLQEPDWTAFFEALVAPPPPNRKLRAAYRRHRTLTS